MRIARILDSDLARANRLTGKNLDTAEEPELTRILAEYNLRLKDGSYNFYVMTGRKYLLDYRSRDRFNKVLNIKQVHKKRLPRFLKEDEVKQLVKGASNLRDRVIIELLWETGCRPGELLNLRIKNIQFDDYSAIINLSGKTGDRLARVFVGKPDLLEHLNSHPRKEDPEAHLIVTNDHWRRPIHQRTLGLLLAILGHKILGKRVNPCFVMDVSPRNQNSIRIEN